MLIDSHCHLASSKFTGSELGGLVQRAEQNGVSRMVTLATNPDNFLANLKIAMDYPGVRCALGIHPCEVHSVPATALDELSKHLGKTQVVAMGETGLDYYHPAPDGVTEATYRKLQQESLEQHFKLAAAFGLNLVIHTRDRVGEASFQDALSIYRRHSAKVRAVFHCYVGSLPNAMAVIELGGLLSFGGVATFKNAAEVRAVVTSIPAGTLMLETDSPYLAPHPHRGKRNEPSMLTFIATTIAEARGLSAQKLAEETWSTAKNFFRGIE